MVEQLAFPLKSERARASRFNVEDMRLLIRTASPTVVCNLAVRARREGDLSYLRVLAPLVTERARRLKAGRPRRLLFWAIAELHNELGGFAKAADLYAKAADGLADEDDDEDGADALLLACRRARALCLARLGFRTEAKAEYERYRNVAGAYPGLTRAHMEKRLGDTQAALGHFRDSYRSYGTAYNLYRQNRRPRMAAESIIWVGGGRRCS